MGIFTNSYVKNITIGDNVKWFNNSMARAFENCTNFNSPVQIPDYITNLYMTFNNCRSFNQPVRLPPILDAYGMYGTFYWCSNFNQPITIPNGVKYMTNTFSSCYNFNQPITIPNGVIDLDSAFRTCSNFNQPITIPNSVTNMSQAFHFCNNFNQPVIIGDNVTNLHNAFRYCKNMGCNITILSTNVNNVKGMINYKSTYSRVNIIVPKSGTTYTTIKNTSSSRSVTSTTLQWTYDNANSCIYNTAQNVYIYNIL